MTDIATVTTDERTILSFSTRTHHLSAEIWTYELDERRGFVTVDEFDGAAAIVDSHTPRVWLSETDTVIIGAGADEVEVGDQFEVFRPGKRVYDPSNGRVFGFATTQLGWVEVEAAIERAAQEAEAIPTGWRLLHRRGTEASSLRARVEDDWLLLEAPLAPEAEQARGRLDAALKARVMR